ncbi:hypothetical protein P4C99_01580 [Pontiellaceae bacterium B1224]|nr:hypothetical protein [Pontiellaceae bacterium B1224]
MKTKLSRIFAPPAEEKIALNPSTLVSDLDSIKTNLHEVYNLKQKRFGNTLVHVLWREIDLEEAWPSSQEFLQETYKELCQIALQLNVTLKQPELIGSFRKAIALFIQQTNCIIEQVQSDPAPRFFNRDELMNIDAGIFKIQHSITRLNKHILTEFDFTPIPKNPARRPQQVSSHPQSTEEYLISSALSSAAG